MFKTILLAYDGSEHAQNAMKAATGLARQNDADLHVVHIPQIDTPPIVIGSFVSDIGMPPTQEEVEQAGQFIADQARAEALARGVQLAEVHLAKGIPANMILAKADKIGADLIVMGRRGLGALGALALGVQSRHLVDRI